MANSVADPQVVLVNSNRWKPALMPLALHYLGAALEQKGIGYEVLDLGLTTNPSRAISDFFAVKKPRLIGITFRNLDDILCSISFLDYLKQTVERIHAASDAPIVVGGSGFSIAPDKILDYCGADLGVCGEGEEALVLLYERLGDEAAYSDIPGLVYRTKDGIVRNPLRAMPLESFSVAGTKSLAVKAYFKKNGRPISSLGVQTKRGCPNRCSYCVIPNCEGDQRRLRPAGVIADEIEHAVSLGARSLFFADGEFNDPPEHAAAICEEIIKRDLQKDMAWCAYITCYKFDRELATLMKRAGCQDAISDFDHSDDAILELMRKRHRQADVLRTAEIARETGLTITFPILVGGPGESLETFQQAIDFCRKNKFKRVSATEPPGLRIYPNTPLADRVFEEGFSPKNANLWGAVKGNEDLLLPVWYISAALGPMRPLMAVWRQFILGYYKAFPPTRWGMIRARSPLR